MNELKPCPLCGYKADYFYSDDVDFSCITPEKTPSSKYVTIRCRNCFCGIGLYKDEQRAAEVWNRREKAERENPQPLTLEELREMCNEPVWIRDLLIEKCSRWHLISENAQLGLIAIDCQCDKLKNHMTGCIYNLDNPNDSYGKTWLAYRYKPKEAQA